jgi:hypothetical protein
MQDKQLLLDLLNAEIEFMASSVLSKRGLLKDPTRWRPLGRMRNNQSVVHAQQSTAAAALVEKFTNGLDAILMRLVKAEGIDPRSPQAPSSMARAIQKYFGELSEKTMQEIRAIAEENLVLYATGTKTRPCLSLYDAGEGQLAKDFPETFCSLIYGNDEGSYKGAVPFVQGRFNMGGTGVLPFCGDTLKAQLIVSRVPADVAKTDEHEWAFTVFCFFPSAQSPEWRYLVGADGEIMTAGKEPLGLVPVIGAKSGEAPPPRERKVLHGTLIKMYDYKAPRSNICGELFKKLEEYLLRPMLPLRVIECRTDYKANVMGVNVWNRFSAWAARDKLEEGFEEGASIQIKLSTGETIPAEVRVFKSDAGNDDAELPQTGLRALINGQSHAKRDTQFFKGKAVDKEHIGGSMLVTLDCSELGQASRNALFMSNRETFREDPLLAELFKKLQNELKNHEGLIALDTKRYEEKIANATSDDDGINALEELLSTDPQLADLFGSMTQGKVAARTIAAAAKGLKVLGTPPKFVGQDFPTFFKRADGSTSVEVELPQNDQTRVSFSTDVKNNYFTRSKHKGRCFFTGQLQPTIRLFNGRLTFTFQADKSKLSIGSEYDITASISDASHGPWKLSMKVRIVEPREKKEREKGEPKEPKVDAEHSRPDIVEVHHGPDALPIKVEKVPGTARLQLQVNVDSKLLAEAKALRKPEEARAVEFVFKYGLALVAMGLLDTAKKTVEWQTDEVGCRDRIAHSAVGVGRVIVPLCLTLPEKLPKAA